MQVHILMWSTYHSDVIKRTYDKYETAKKHLEKIYLDKVAKGFKVTYRPGSDLVEVKDKFSSKFWILSEEVETKLPSDDDLYSGY